MIAALVLAFAGTGCIDLAEPSIPNLGASAVFNVTVRQIQGTPIDVSGTLQAGRDSAGFRRSVITPVVVLSVPFVLGTPNAQGVYVISKQIPDSAKTVGPFLVQPPAVENLPTPTFFSWYGVKRLDADTVKADSLGDVTLHVQTEFGGTVTPAGRTRQWFLELRGDANTINVSGTGAPPATLRIPSQFIPASPTNKVFANLIYLQSAVLVSQPAGYISSVTLDIRTTWIIRLR